MLNKVAGVLLALAPFFFNLSSCSPSSSESHSHSHEVSVPRVNSLPSQPSESLLSLSLKKRYSKSPLRPLTLLEREKRGSHHDDHHNKHHHHHGDHKHSKKIRKIHRHGRRGMYGSQFATYLATVTISGDLFDCVMDTGSSDFAVAASPTCGCPTYYKGRCEGTYLHVEYGEGNWTGHACTDTVVIGKTKLPNTVFAGMETQVEMLDCENGNRQNGIIGLAYPKLLGPPDNYTLPFFDILTAHTGIPRVFSMQCCGWAKPPSFPTRSPKHGRARVDPNDPEIGDHAQDEASNEIRLGSHDVYAAGLVAFNVSEYAQGALDLGGVNPKHYDGHFWWTPISQQLYYAVELLDVRVGNVSVYPHYRIPRDAVRSRIVSDALTLSADLPIQKPGEESDMSIPELPITIVDSGTSDLVFTPDLNRNILTELKKWRPQASDAIWNGDECVPHSETLGREWPSLTLVFAGEGARPPFDVIIPWCRYLSTAPSDDCNGMVGGHAFSIEPSDNMEDGNILGQVFMEEYYTVHDLDRSLIGIAPIDGCPFKHECRAAPIVRHAAVPGTVLISKLDEAEMDVRIDQFQLWGLNARALLLLILIGIMAVVTVSAPIIARCVKRSKYEPIPSEDRDAVSL